MALNKIQKKAQVADLKVLLEGAKCAILVDYCGLTVAQDTKFRRSMREVGVKYLVAKNTLINIAAKEVGIEGLDTYLSHNTAIAVSDEDPVAVAKVVNDFAKANKLVMKIKVGILDKKIIGSDEVKALAELPSREVLLSKMLGSMQAPISGLANVLQGTIRKFVYALEAVRKEKESA